MEQLFLLGLLLSTLRVVGQMPNIDSAEIKNNLIRTRVPAYNKKINTRSAPGKGTEVNIEIELIV